MACYDSARYAANGDRIRARKRAAWRANPQLALRDLARQYGLTVDERAALLANPCAICGGVATCIDHDHATGEVRGALCGPCNKGIGQLGDDPERVSAAAAYLAGKRRLRVVA